MTYNDPSKPHSPAELGRPVRALARATRRLAEFRRQAASAAGRSGAAVNFARARAALPRSAPRALSSPGPRRARPWDAPGLDFEANGGAAPSFGKGLPPPGAAMGGAALSRPSPKVFGRSTPGFAFAARAKRPGALPGLSEVRKDAPPRPALEGAAALPARLTVQLRGPGEAARAALSAAARARKPAIGKPPPPLASPAGIGAGARSMTAVHEGGRLARRSPDPAAIFPRLGRTASPEAVVRREAHTAGEARGMRARAVASAPGGAAAGPLAATLRRLEAAHRHRESLCVAPGALAHALAAAARPVARALWQSRATGGASFASRAAEVWPGRGGKRSRSGASPVGSSTVRQPRSLAPAAPARLARPGMVQAGRQGPAREALPASMPIINSAPTIIINRGEPADLERRLLEALRRHRDALFDQWRAERQKRARTEF